MNSTITGGSPGSPVVRTPPFYCRGHGFSLSLRSKILPAAQSSQIYTYIYMYKHTYIHIYVYTEMKNILEGINRITEAE